MSDYVSILLMIVAVLGVGIGMIVLTYLLGPTHRSDVKQSPFECGNPSVGSPRKQFNVKFYVVALLFLVFDIEAVFIYPWAVIYRELGMLGLVEMVLFLATLAVGLVYVWRRGALDWNVTPGDSKP